MQQQKQRRRWWQQLHLLKQHAAVLLIGRVCEALPPLHTRDAGSYCQVWVSSLGHSHSSAGVLAMPKRQPETWPLPASLPIAATATSRLMAGVSPCIAAGMALVLLHHACQSASSGGVAFSRWEVDHVRPALGLTLHTSRVLNATACPWRAGRQCMLPDAHVPGSSPTAAMAATPVAARVHMDHT